MYMYIKILLSSLFLFGFVEANTLSQTYPVLGVAPNMGVEFFLYLMNLIIVGGTIIAVVGLVYQGMNILLAGEDAGKVTEARKSITGLFLGLIILLGSTVILKEINPELLKMTLERFEAEIKKDDGGKGPNKDSPLVEYAEVPMGAILESVLNAVSTSPSQAYNFSSVKIGTGGKHTEEICYLYDKYGNAIDKNGDGYITEMDEYQGVDFKICINELLKAAEHKILFLNDGNYRCGMPGNNDEDSPIGSPAIKKWDDDPDDADSNGYISPNYGSGYDEKIEGRTALNVNYHDWDKENWTKLNNKEDSAKTDKKTGDPIDDASDNTIEKSLSADSRCRYGGNCEEDGLHGIINNLKEYIRNGCVCSETDDRTSNLYASNYVGCEGAPGGGIKSKTSFYCRSKSGCGVWCDINCNDGGSGCCGGPRGRDETCQTKFNNIDNALNPYVQHDPCMKRKSMDCMREFINIIIYGDVNTDMKCAAQETKQGPSQSIKMGWKCNDFVYNQKPEIVEARKTEYLLAYYQRLISFKHYYRNRLNDLEKAETYISQDKRLKVYSKAQFQEMQGTAKETYSFDQEDLKLSTIYETGTYRKRFNCAAYEDPVTLSKKNIYEDDDYRLNMFACNWEEDNYSLTQKDNKLVRIRTSNLISNLHVDQEVEGKAYSSKDLNDEERDRRICSKGELETLKGKNALFSNVTSECVSGEYGTTPISEDVTGALFDTEKRRFVLWKDNVYEKGGYSYLDQGEQYWTGEDMATDGDPLTFYVLKDVKGVVDPFYTGRDKMPYYFKSAFIDYSQFSENTAIDTQIGTERGFLLPSLIPIGQLSYHTKIYAKQMIRMIDRTLEQLEGAIIALDNIANVYPEGNYSAITKIDYETGHVTNGGEKTNGCDCRNCSNESDCVCTEEDEDCGCIRAECSDSCSACEVVSEQKTCFACAKVTRYTKFLTPSYTKYYGKNNSEPVVEDVINDNLPASIKMIVRNMSCGEDTGGGGDEEECVEDEESYEYKKITGEIKKILTGFRQKKVLAKITFDWDGKADVGISNKKGSVAPIWLDDALLVLNETNSKELTYYEDYETGGDITIGNISSILVKGTNTLLIEIQDIGDHYAGIGECWLYIGTPKCEEKDDKKANYNSSYVSQLVVSAGGGKVKYQYEEISVGKINLTWNGSEKILISSDSKTLKDVTADDALMIKNHTNGKEKEFKAAGNSTWSGQVSIEELLSSGVNELEFIVKDYHAVSISWSNIYILKGGTTGFVSNCKCSSANYPVYSPPEGYRLTECNAWDRELREERPCVDYKNDIVVYLEAERTDEECPCD